MRNASQLPKGLAPDTPIRPGKEMAGQPPAAGEIGWLLAVAAAFFLIHIVAGIIRSPASSSETTSSGQEVISSLYD
jgi:hypothetical protein